MTQVRPLEPSLRPVSSPRKASVGSWSRMKAVMASSLSRSARETQSLRALRSASSFPSCCQYRRRTAAPRRAASTATSMSFMRRGLYARDCYNRLGMPGPQRKTRNEHSSGGAVLCNRDGKTCVAMIATRRKTRWGLPKGAVAEGETSEQAALREVPEETGLEAKIVRPLDPIEYYVRAGDTLIRKRVDFYLMEYVSGELQPQLSEVDDVEWVELTRAVQRASFDSERKLLSAALER